MSSVPERIVHFKETASFSLAKNIHRTCNLHKDEKIFEAHK
jgi:hypothetical protein